MLVWVHAVGGKRCWSTAKLSVLPLDPRLDRLALPPTSLASLQRQVDVLAYVACTHSVVPLGLLVWKGLIKYILKDFVSGFPSLAVQFWTTVSHRWNCLDSMSIVSLLLFFLV